MSQAPPGCDPEVIACPCCSSIWQTLYHTPMQCPTSQRRYSGGMGNHIDLSDEVVPIGFFDNFDNNINNNNNNSRNMNHNHNNNHNTNIPSRQYPPPPPSSHSRDETYNSNTRNPWSTNTQTNTPNLSGGSDYMAAATGIGLPKGGRGSRGGGRSTTNSSGRGRGGGNFTRFTFFSNIFVKLNINRSMS